MEKEKSITEDPMALNKAILDNLEAGNFNKVNVGLVPPEEPSEGSEEQEEQ